ncbi:MAG: flavodoxin domain-containing protein [Candidatus Marinimicrobia bacterium]|jgi:menaquinone-dependent protoporphyrinogen oxidase|nr:flavodoxin domain-containing protein [Candidatus Neomarinimicrobiota bacterium]
MKTLIVYATQHGCTEKCAENLARQLAGEVRIVDLKKVKKPALDQFEIVIIGGSIHAGRIQKKVRKFCIDNRVRLMSKRLGLFLCCMEEGEKALEQFDQVFPDDLRAHAVARGLFGGAFDFSRMNWIEKAIIKKISKIEDSVSKIKEDEITRFAKIFTTT